MHSLLLAMYLVVGADVPERWEPAMPAQPAIETTTGNGSVAGPAGLPGPYRYDPPRDPQETDTVPRAFFKYCGAWWRPMPQTCYSPHYGCYPGNGRDIQRYPAFHGYYYRQAYNYRPLFEYPWQADVHEPLPLEVAGEPTAERQDGRPGGPRREVIETPSPRESKVVP